MSDIAKNENELTSASFDMTKVVSKDGKIYIYSRHKI